MARTTFEQDHRNGYHNGAPAPLSCSLCRAEEEAREAGIGTDPEQSQSAKDAEAQKQALDAALSNGEWNLILSGLGLLLLEARKPANMGLYGDADEIRELSDKIRHGSEAR